MVTARLRSAGFRERVEATSRPALVRLHRMPRPLIPLATLALVGVGVLAPLPVGLTALLVVFTLIAWIAYLSWPAVATFGRVLRICMLGLIVLLAVSRF